MPKSQCQWNFLKEVFDDNQFSFKNVEAAPISCWKHRATPGIQN